MSIEFQCHLLQKFVDQHHCSHLVALDYLGTEGWNYEDARVSFLADKKLGLA